MRVSERVYPTACPIADLPPLTIQAAGNGYAPQPNGFVHHTAGLLQLNLKNTLPTHLGLGNTSSKVSTSCQEKNGIARKSS